MLLYSFTSQDFSASDRKDYSIQMYQMDDIFTHNMGFLHFGPRMLLTGNPIDIKLYFRVPLDTYCQMNDKPDPSNANTPRTTGILSVHSQGDLQGG